MSDPYFTPEYWQERWDSKQTGWDIGHPSPPITAYFESVKNKESTILIPGCGNAWEGEFLVKNGFSEITLLDIAPGAIDHVRSRSEILADEHLKLGDFFKQESTYDYIVEQTFFCALHPSLRPEYAKKAHELLKPKGILTGVLFDRVFGNDHPPFGGNREEYLSYFEPYFEPIHFEPCRNSIEPRQGSELFIELRRR